MEFVLGGLAAVGAAVFTNPLEVLKIRMQLQGELRHRGQHAMHYKNMFHAAFVVARADGLLALQKGLVPALWTQLLLNGLRLGVWQAAHNRGLLTGPGGEMSLWRGVLVGSTGGALGAAAASPLFLVKTHLQSSSHESVAVGHQHRHTGTWNALTNIYTKHGILGLYRGVEATVSRAAVGSTFQLTSFTLCKDWMTNRQLFTDSPILKSFFASLVGGVALSVAIAPFDLISTRLYNQGLVPALCTQMIQNGLRFGVWEAARNRGLLSGSNGDVSLWRGMLAGATGGSLGAAAASPLFLVKTHLQSYSHASVAVGHQHRHAGTYSALKNIYTQHGILGLYRGVEATIPRAAVGSSCQLMTFTLCKQWMTNKQLFTDSPVLMSFCASFIGGVAISLTMTPLDLVSIRLYNQGVDTKGKGLLYNGIIDCVMKIWKTEGFLGFYKGLLPNYVRLGPHTVLCLVFWDKLKTIHNDFYKHFDENVQL